jgi:pyrroline-5-carboxylate reductase
MSVTLPSIAILGAGAMGGAIVSGLVKPGVVVDGAITVTTASAATAEAIGGPGVTAISLDIDPDGNSRAAAKSRIVVVAVKPAKVVDVLRSIAPHLRTDAIVVSVAAGVPIAKMQALVSCSVLRAMPNTPALVGRGVTGVAAGAQASGAELELVVSLFETVGTVLVVPEEKIDALSTISGSGPAYVFYLIEELTKTAIGLGFSSTEAATMVSETFLGASELLAASGALPADLRRQVTSPSGTTERAIAELERADLSALFDRATAAALARARELAGQS